MLESKSTLSIVLGTEDKAVGTSKVPKQVLQMRVQIETPCVSIDIMSIFEDSSSGFWHSLSPSNKDIMCFELQREQPNTSSVKR